MNFPMECTVWSHTKKCEEIFMLSEWGERSQEKDEEEEEGEGQMKGQEKKEREKSVVYPPWSCCPLSKHVFNTEPHLFLLMSKDAIFSMGRRNKILLAWWQSEFAEAVSTRRHSSGLSLAKQTEFRNEEDEGEWVRRQRDGEPWGRMCFYCILLYK